MLKKIVLVILIEFLVAGFAQAEVPNALEYYKVFSGSKKMSDVQVFLIGETHTVPFDQKMFSQMAESYRTPDESVTNYVLLEGFGRKGDYRVLNDSLSNLLSIGGEKAHSPFRVMGWDDQWNYLLTMSSYDVTLEASKIYQNENTEISKKAQVALKLWFQKAWRSSMFKKRNDAMMETVKEALEKTPNGKIFILAGSDHFSSDSRLAHYLYWKHIKYTVLIPKEDHPLRVRTMSDIEYIESLKDK